MSPESSLAAGADARAQAAATRGPHATARGVLRAQPGTSTTGVRQFLSFQLAGLAFALDILAIDEIIRHRRPTPVPRAPGAVCGMINLRGAVVPVLDLARHLGLSREQQPPEQRCIVVVRAPARAGSQTLGLLVDVVSTVIAIAPERIETVPAFGIGVTPEFLDGVVSDADRFTLVLDLSRACAPDVVLAPRGAGASGGYASDTAARPEVSHDH